MKEKGKVQINRIGYQLFYKDLILAFSEFVYSKVPKPKGKQTDTPSVWDAQNATTKKEFSLELFGDGTNDRRFFHKHLSYLTEDPEDAFATGLIHPGPLCKALEFLGFNLPENSFDMEPKRKATLLFDEFLKSKRLDKFCQNIPQQADELGDNVLSLLCQTVENFFTIILSGRMDKSPELLDAVWHKITQRGKVRIAPALIDEKDMFRRMYKADRKPCNLKAFMTHDVGDDSYNCFVYYHSLDGISDLIDTNRSSQYLYTAGLEEIGDYMIKHGEGAKIDLKDIEYALKKSTIMDEFWHYAAQKHPVFNKFIDKPYGKLNAHVVYKCKGIVEGGAWKIDSMFMLSIGFRMI